jgi:hypothetical protein
MNDPQTHRFGRWQFSLRSLLVVTLVAAVLSAVGRPWPHVALFLAGVLPAPYLTARLTHLWYQRRRAGWVLITACILAWLTCYVAFAGPVAYAVETDRLSARTARTIYAPFVWLQKNTPVRKALEWYRDHWQEMW